MQISLLSGIYTNETPDFRTSYPRNLVPVPKGSGISGGYLKHADGLIQFGAGPGIDRGGINWNGVCYRVMGTKLVRVASDGAVTVLGDVGGTDQVVMDYSFDRLGIASGGNLFYWNGLTLTQVTDPDLGNVVDMLWVDGYFMTTDGEFLVVTELNDPLSVNPLKYGSSEADPDRVKAIWKWHNEVYALNRYTIEVFDNVGGDNFPFQRIDGALIEKGAVGTHACCLFGGGVAFVGSGRNESCSIYVGSAGGALKIATQEIDLILQEYSEAQLENSVLEAKTDKAHQHLLLHLPDQVLVYDLAASQVLGEPIWFTLTTSIVGKGTYRARNLVWCYDKWIAGDPTSANLGTLDSSAPTHYGQTVGWEFGTQIIYAGGNGLIVHQMELVGLPGRAALGVDPTIWTSYSIDGETWSQEHPISAGTQGQRNKRLAWRKQGSLKNWRIQKFRGTSDAPIAFARLELQVEPLFLRAGNG